MEWTYDASGAKWLKKINNGGVISEKRYLDNLEYSGSNLEAIYFAGGRVVPEDAGYAYQYIIRDHLGNSRVMFKDKVGGPKKKQVGAQRRSRAARIGKNHYYSYGMNMDGVFIGNNHKYQYNGKELNDDLGYNQYDYGARWYDPSVGRFTGVDPLASKYPGWSPYVYTLNNPIRYIDPDGRSATDPPYGRVVGIFYHGGPTGGGQTTTPAKAGGTGDFYNAAKSYASAAGREFVGTVIAPGFTSASGVENGMNFIDQNLRDGDQVIVYGYSYGVDVAVDLSTQLKELGVDVSLLITVDGSDGPLQNSTVNTTIPDNVNTNLNVYQTNDSGTSSSSRSTGATSSNSSSGSSSSNSGTLNFPGSNGGPNKAQNSSKTNVINKNVTAPGTTHGNIQSKQKDLINNTLQQTIQGGG